MPILALLTVIEQYGPSAANLVKEIVNYVEANNGTVSAADLALLKAYGAKKSAEYLAAAGGAP